MIDDIFTGNGAKYKILNKGEKTMSKDFTSTPIDNFTTKSQLQQQTDLAKIGETKKQSKTTIKLNALNNIKPPEKKSRAISLKVKPSTYEKLEKKADKLGFTSLNSLISELLDAYARS